jgi:gluconate kinase
MSSTGLSTFNRQLYLKTKQKLALQKKANVAANSDTNNVNNVSPSPAADQAALNNQDKDEITETKSNATSDSSMINAAVASLDHEYNTVFDEFFNSLNGLLTRYGIKFSVETELHKLKDQLISINKHHKLTIIKQNQALQNDLIIEKQTNSAKISELNEAIRTNKHAELDKISKLQLNLTKSNKTIESQREELAKLKAELQSAQGNILKQTKLTEKQKKELINELTGKMEAEINQQKQTEIMNLHNTIEQLNAAVLEQKQSNLQLKSELSQLNQRLSTEKQRLAAANAIHKQLEDRLQQKANDFQTVSLERQASESNSNALQRQMNELKNELLQAQLEYKKLSNENNNNNTVAHNQASQIQQLTLHLSQLKLSHQQQFEQVQNKITNILQKKDAQREQLKGQITLLTNQLRQTEQQLQLIQAQTAELRAL